MKILLTGASGFVGAHVLRHLLTHTNAEIICPVTFRHQGMPRRIASALEGHDSRRVLVERMDLAAGVDWLTAKRWGAVEVIMNVASDSHVDRSIDFPESFIANNVAMMTGVLEYARHVQPFLFLQMSTDEVYGPAPRGYAHREWDTILPSNPYSASKAAQEAVAVSYWRTFGVPVVITNTMNIIGEMQDPEKFVPKVMQKVARKEVMPLHTSASGEMGSRFYLHGRNLADAWLFLMNRYMLFPPDMYGDVAVDRPEKWNIVGEREVNNLEMAQMVAQIMGQELLWEDVDFHTSRPGHDLRYALDGSKLAAAGWKAPISLEDGLRRTVEWTMVNEEWL